MRKALLLLLVLLLIPSAYAVTLEDFNNTAFNYYPLDVHAADTSPRSAHLSTQGPTYQSTSCMKPNCGDTDGVNDYWQDSNYHSTESLTDATFNAWVNFSGTQSINERILAFGSSNDDRGWLGIDGSDSSKLQVCIEFNTPTCSVKTGTTNIPSELFMLTWRFNDTGNLQEVFINGVEDTGLQDTSNNQFSQIGNLGDTSLTLAALRSDASWIDGYFDEFAIFHDDISNEMITALYQDRIYWDGDQWINQTTPAAQGQQGERLEQAAVIKQDTPVTINSVLYADILTSTVNITSITPVYAFTSIPISPTASNQADCKITIDGSDFGATERSRSLTAGEEGNLLIMSQSEVLGIGNHDVALECKRTGGGSFTVSNASILFHELASVDGTNLTRTEESFSSLSIASLPTTFNLTTSVNNTEYDLVRALVLEWGG